MAVLGGTGGAKAGRPVRFSLKRRDFQAPAQVTPKTDPRGRVSLGPLAGVLSVTATGPGETAHAWPSPSDRYTCRGAFARVLPCPSGGGDGAERGRRGRAGAGRVRALEVRDDVVAADRFAAPPPTDGRLTAAGLEPGDYGLRPKRTGEKVRVHVTGGSTAAGNVLGRLRQLQVARLRPVQTAGVAADVDAVTVRPTDASTFTRVHVVATRRLPPACGPRRRVPARARPPGLRKYLGNTFGRPLPPPDPVALGRPPG